MSVQKRSLIGSRPAQKKATTKPVKGNDAIGESKPLTANALTRSFMKQAVAKRTGHIVEDL